MLRRVFATVCAVGLLAAPVLAANPPPNTTGVVGTPTQVPPPNAEKPQTTGGAVTAETPTGAQSALPTDKGTSGGTGAGGAKQ